MCSFHGDEIVGCLSERSSSSLALLLLAVGASCRCWIWVVALVSVFVSRKVAHVLIIVVVLFFVWPSFFQVHHGGGEVI